MAVAAPPIRVLVVFGTRPEAIKLCPLVNRLQRYPETFSTQVCVTAQHRSMLDQVLSAFCVEPEYDLNIMQPGQTLSQVAARAIASLGPVIDEVRPDSVAILCYSAWKEHH